MLEMTDGYKSAIVGDVRRMYIKAMLEIIDPDIVYVGSNGSGAAPWSKSDQLFDKNMAMDARYATLEPGHWVLDGSFRLIPDDPTALSGEVGHVGDVLSNEDGTFSTEVYAELKFQNVSILQACSVYFSTDSIDGIPVDFRVSVMSEETAVFTQEYTDNTAYSVSLDGFTVYDPTAIRVYVTRWSLPRRRIRVAEIIPGVYEEWTEDTLASLDVQMRGNFACLAIPYGVATLRMDNLDRRFEPRNKSGVFQSIEERQGILIALGVKLADGSIEWKRLGIFYQANGGWKTGDNDLTMQWELVDIIGLLAGREFVAPDTLPTTLGGWLAALVGQLGANFANMWHADPDYTDTELTVNDASEVTGKKCGDILRWACMASGTWPRADAETGFLTAEPFWSQGNKYDLDNMTVYPVMKANDDLAVLTFKLYDGNGTIYNVSGNATSSSNTLTVNNPFIHTEAQALTASRQILSQYGGIKLELTGRGDPSSEIGDVDTVWLNESTATTGRRMEQSFGFSNGVLQNCRSVLLQADGSFMFERCVVLTGSGEWTPPNGVTEIRYILGQGAQGSTAGQDGQMYKYHSGFGEKPSSKAADGTPGKPGRILSGTTTINAGAAIAYSCGKGTEAGAYGATVPEGEDTTFGPNLTTADGKIYENGYTDIASGNSYGRAGVAKPIDGTSDAGAAGLGGMNEIWRYSHNEPFYDGDGNISGSQDVYNKVSSKTNGTPGVKGADGFIVIYWDKEAET